MKYLSLTGLILLCLFSTSCEQATTNQIPDPFDNYWTSKIPDPGNFLADLEAAQPKNPDKNSIWAYVGDGLDAVAVNQCDHGNCEQESLMIFEDVFNYRIQKNRKSLVPVPKWLGSGGWGIIADIVECAMSYPDQTMDSFEVSGCIANKM